MLVRKYRPGEEPELWQLFFNTIRTVNLGDYTAEQVRVWAPEDTDPERWRARIEGICPWVCVEEGDVIVGYADLQDSGYIDHFFVHHAWQRRGVGRRLMETIETEARARRIPELSAEVSVTARPFFEAFGFTVVEVKDTEVDGLVMRNFAMTRRLAEDV